MQLRRVEVEREVQRGQGAEGAFYLGDARKRMAEILGKYKGQVQLIYMDPPFATGGQFSMRMRVGEREWKSGNGSLVLPAYSDGTSAGEYMALMREALAAARELLSESGVIFLHIDFRMHAQLRLLMDELFGEKNFLNEIIWAYQTGGRARRYFSRKHDIILFYRKGHRYYFNINAIPVARQGNRRNHMKRHIDTDGRVYRSIRSGGKIYTYYDDEPAYPGDVWDDVSHMQQKDPQRTGYDTQKPLSLLERIVLCATRPGDIVLDPFAGSGTTLEAAQMHGRRFVGIDQSLLSLNVVRRRLQNANVLYDAPACAGEPCVRVSMLSGIAFYDVEITAYELEPGLTARPITGMDALDNWAVGYIRDGAFTLMAHEYRSRQTPALSGRLQLPVLSGTPAVRVGDVMGRYFYYILDNGSEA